AARGTWSSVSLAGAQGWVPVHGDAGVEPRGRHSRGGVGLRPAGPGPRQRRRTDVPPAPGHPPRRLPARRPAPGPLAGSPPAPGGLSVRRGRPGALGRHHRAVRAGRPGRVVPHLRLVPEPQVLCAVRQPAPVGRRHGRRRPGALARERPGGPAARLARHRRLGARPVVRLHRLDRHGAGLAGGRAGLVPRRPGERVVRHRGRRGLGAGRRHLLRGADAGAGLCRAGHVQRTCPHRCDRAAGDDDAGAPRGARQPVPDRRGADHRRLRVPARGHLGDDGPDGRAAAAAPRRAGLPVGVPCADGGVDGLPGLALLRGRAGRGRPGRGGCLDRRAGHRERVPPSVVDRSAGRGARGQPAGV
ncbi:MAG: hypothetical protein AVDCRST_MAG34-691, partial [uncultured Nocardioidaceae bacterium]